MKDNMIKYLMPIILLFSSLSAEEELTDAIFRRTNPERVGEIYQILKIMDTVFRKHHIHYWIDSGTLLGAHRHKGLIPWDDDADVCLRVKDRKKVAKLTAEFEKQGVVLYQRNPLPWKLHLPHQKYYCVDIFFVWDETGDGKLTYRSDWAGHWFENEIKKTVRVAFGPIKLNAPINPWRKLFEKYGTDCMKKAMYHTHVRGDLPYKVTIVDFNPAPYAIDPDTQIIDL